MKLYGIFQSYKGIIVLEACEVEKEIQKSYILTKHERSYNMRIIPKDHPMLAFSPAAAIEKFVSRCERKKDNFEGRIRVLNKAIEDANKLPRGEK